MTEPSTISTASSQLKPRGPWALLAGLILIVLSFTVLDQVTKIHSEQHFMVSSHPTDVHMFRSTKLHVFTWGESPASTRMATEGKDMVTANWLDLHLTYVRNVGAAWGALSNLPKAVRAPLFIIATIIAIAVVGHLFHTSHPGQRLFRTCLAFILAGAVGNFIDRIWLGYVIDWVQFHWMIFGWEYSFPVFNVADIAINIGVGLFLIDMLLNELANRRLKKEMPLSTSEEAKTDV